MTITDNGRRSTDQLVAQARELVEGGRLPSKNQVRQALKVSWPTAVEVFQALTAEASRERAERVAKRQAIAARRRSGPVTDDRSPRRRVRLLHVPATRPPAAERVPAELAGKNPTDEPGPAPRRVVTWPALLVAAPAFVAIWAGWVAIGKMTGFGKVNLLPGIGDGWVIDTAITLPIGVEAYAGYAFYVALNPAAPQRARKFAAWSAVGAVLLGMGGQTAYHLMSANHMVLAPWQITTVVSCLPVLVFGLVAMLVHMVRAEEPQ